MPIPPEEKTVSAAVQSPESPQPKQHSDVSLKARACSVLAAVILETYGTYPLDVVKNRQMMGKRLGQLTSTPLVWWQHMIGPEHAQLNLRQPSDCYKAMKFTYRGVTGYGVYKFFNRGFKFGLQPWLMEGMMKTDMFSLLANQVGFDFAKIFTSTAAGMGSGIAEIVANPVDRMKLLCQKFGISPGAALSMMKKEGLAVQFSAVKETAARNVVGSGTLFFGKYATYAALGVTDHNQPTVYQSLLSSLIGNGAMIVVSHPFDLVKVRVQMAEKLMQPNAVSIKRSMMQTFFHISKTEGWRAAWSGIEAKLIGSGLKGTFI